MNELRLELKQYIPRLISGIKEMISLVHEGKIHESLSLLHSIIEGLDWVIKGYSLISNENNINEIDKINSILETINEALDKADYVLVSDLFEYELISILNEMNSYAINDISDLK